MRCLDAVKVWARGIFALSILSSTASLLVPKNVHRQVKFVLAMLLLLCTVTPLVQQMPRIKKGILPGTGDASFSQSGPIKDFFEKEIADIVEALLSQAGYAVLAVKPVTDGFSLKAIVLEVEAPLPEKTAATLINGLSAYLGVQKENIAIVSR